MDNVIQFLRDQDGKKVGVYLPIEIWESFLKGDLKILDKFQKKNKRNSTKIKLPSCDLGGDFMPSREELYDEHLFKDGNDE